MEHRMPLERFEVLLDQYGADVTQWPPQDASAAADLLSESAAARSALEGAQALDRLLDLVPSPPSASVDLAAKILAARPAQGGASRPSLGGSPVAKPDLMPDLKPDLKPDLAATQNLGPITWISPTTIAARGSQELESVIARKRSFYLLPAAALTASLVLGVLSGAVVHNRVGIPQVNPSVSDLFALTTQVAALPLEMEAPE